MKKDRTRDEIYESKYTWECIAIYNTEHSHKYSYRTTFKRIDIEHKTKYPTINMNAYPGTTNYPIEALK